jgi:hypothetical protein
VERLRIPECELPIAERSDDERRGLGVGPHELLLDAVQVLDRAPIVFLVVRGDETFGKTVQRAGLEGERLYGVSAG